MPKKEEKNDTSPGKGVPPKKKNNYSKFMQREIFMKEEIKEEGEEKTMETISAANGKAQRKRNATLASFSKQAASRRTGDGRRWAWSLATKHLINLASKSTKKRSCRNVQPESKLKPPGVLRPPYHLGIHLARRRQKAGSSSNRKNAVGGRKSGAAM